MLYRFISGFNASSVEVELFRTSICFLYLSRFNRSYVFYLSLLFEGEGVDDVKF